MGWGRDNGGGKGGTGGGGYDCGVVGKSVMITSPYQSFTLYHQRRQTRKCHLLLWGRGEVVGY